MSFWFLFLFLLLLLIHRKVYVLFFVLCSCYFFLNWIELISLRNWIFTGSNTIVWFQNWWEYQISWYSQKVPQQFVFIFKICRNIKFTHHNNQLPIGQGWPQPPSQDFFSLYTLTVLSIYQKAEEILGTRLGGPIHRLPVLTK